jgi:hypothetical protein
MALTLRAYEPDDATRWDEFCATADQATLLHTRRFLSYHGDRFRDRSVILEDEGRCVGLLPAAEHPADASLVVSHPGITYGGVLHSGGLRGERMVSALAELSRYYAAMGYAKFLYKAVPTFYQRRPAQDDLYALFRAGATRTRCDLSSSIALDHRAAVSERRRRSLKKAQKAGVAIKAGVQFLPALWEVVIDNLSRKHGVKPVHSVAEMQMLMERFPGQIRCVCALLGEEVVAGVVVFDTPTTDHAQYIASSATGYDVSALDAVFEHCITEATAAGKRWFDFGISTEEGGTRLNDGLYGFKTEFGGGGFVHDFYELALKGV